MRTDNPTGGRRSRDDFLAWERGNQVRHEYVAGEAYAMNGASVRHNLITLNMVRALHGPARARGCLVLASDVQLLAAADRVYYPDVMIVCGSAGAVERQVEHPSIVVEVTSTSTRAIDRREKMEVYLRLPSLRTYLIVDQRRRHVLAYRRTDDNLDWSRDEFVAQDDRIGLPSLGGTIALEAIYDGVTLPPLMVREPYEQEWGAD